MEQQHSRGFRPAAAGTQPGDREAHSFHALLIEDDGDDAALVEHALMAAGDVAFKLTHVGNLADALNALDLTEFDAVLLDLTLPDALGMEAFRPVYQAVPHTPIVVLTGLDDTRLSTRAIEEGAQDYLVKDRVHAEVITRVLRYAISRKKVEEDLHQSQEQLRQAQKMEALGQLAGGIAHDFSNLLTSILGFGTVLLESTKEDGEVHQDIQEIVYAGERAATLTRQLLSFARKDLLQIHPMNLNDVVKETHQLLRRTIGEDIELVILLGEDLSPVMADHGQLQQVLMNLGVNARDAMPRGGKLLIETRRRHVDESFCKGREPLRPAHYVQINVADTGEGMTPEVCEHAFEPFFTTKGKDKGTGLGLACVYGVLMQLEGYIEVDSTPGEGTTFRMYLPCTDDVAVASAPRSQAALSGGNETILLVEDEETLRRLASRVLNRLGYEILEARNGTAALDLMKDHEGKVDLVLSDVVMPQMGGPEMVKRLQKMRSGFRVLYMSGFADALIQEHGIQGGRVNLLKKPYTQAVLAQSVREVLDGTGHWVDTSAHATA